MDEEIFCLHFKKNKLHANHARDKSLFFFRSLIHELITKFFSKIIPDRQIMMFWTLTNKRGD